MDCFGSQLTQFDHFVNLGDSDFGRPGHGSVKVPGCALIDQIAPAVGFVRPNQGEVRFDGVFEKVCLTIEDASLFTLLQQGAGARVRVESGDASLSGPDSLRQRALGHQFHAHLTRGKLLMEGCCKARPRVSREGTDFFYELAVFNEQAAVIKVRRCPSWSSRWRRSSGRGGWP